MSYRYSDSKICPLLCIGIMMMIGSIIGLVFTSSFGFGFGSFMIIPEIVMICIGAVLLSIGIYFTVKGDWHSMRYQSSRPSSTIRRRYRTSRKSSRKKTSVLNCPSCKAPLRKSPPCECEYCGRIIK